MSTPLYELSQNYMALLEQAVDESTGEVRPEFTQALERLEGTIQEKLEGCAKVLRMLAGDVDMLETEMERLEKRRNSVVNNADRLREYMRAHMQATQTEKVKGKLFTIWLAKPREHVEVEHPESIPAEYMRQPPPMPDRAAIKKALEDGLAVPGASLKTGQPILNIR